MISFDQPSDFGVCSDKSIWPGVACMFESVKASGQPNA